MPINLACTLATKPLNISFVYERDKVCCVNNIEVLLISHNHVTLVTGDSMSDNAGYGRGMSRPMMDMSHLTPEERSIIEGVMQKQQMEENKELRFLKVDFIYDS